MYREIEVVLRQQGFTVTAYGCRKKFNRLLARYKVVKDNDSRTGKKLFTSTLDLS